MSKFKTLSDVIDPLSAVADEVLGDPHGRGMQYARAVAAGRMLVLEQPGATIDVDNTLVLGRNLQGRARNGSFVVDVGGPRRSGTLDVEDSVVVGNHVRVLSRGHTAVIGQSPHVAIRNRRLPTTHRQEDVTVRQTFTAGKKQHPKTPRRAAAAESHESHRQSAQSSQQQQPRRRATDVSKSRKSTQGRPRRH